MTEAKCIALSALMRELVPMRTIVSELATDGPISDLKINGIKAITDNFKTPTDPDQLKEGMLIASTVHEDNAGCVALANSESMRPHTKHLSIKWHHFRDQVQNGFVKVQKVDAHLNWADPLTKPLVRATCVSLHMMFMEWQCT